MALEKAFTLPNGASGNYIRLGSFAWDRVTKTASASFLLFASSAVASAHPEAPLCVIARLVLSGPKFDEYLGAAEVDAAQFYLAAKAEPLRAGGSLTQDEVNLADAVDV